MRMKLNNINFICKEIKQMAGKFLEKDSDKLSRVWLNYSYANKGIVFCKGALEEKLQGKLPGTYMIAIRISLVLFTHTTFKNDDDKLFVSGVLERREKDIRII